jgi:hypothetical protein
MKQQRNAENYIYIYIYIYVCVENADFWDVAPCRSYVNRRVGGTAFFIVTAVKTSDLTYARSLINRAHLPGITLAI